MQFIIYKKGDVKLRRASKFKHGGIPGNKITNETKNEILKFLDSKKMSIKLVILK